jgi:hypothetical protein
VLLPLPPPCPPRAKTIVEAAMTLNTIIAPRKNHRDDDFICRLRPRDSEEKSPLSRSQMPQRAHRLGCSADFWQDLRGLPIAARQCVIGSFRAFKVLPPSATAVLLGSGFICVEQAAGNICHDRFCETFQVLQNLSNIRWTGIKLPTVAATGDSFDRPRRCYHAPKRCRGTGAPPERPRPGGAFLLPLGQNCGDRIKFARPKKLSAHGFRI